MRLINGILLGIGFSLIVSSVVQDIQRGRAGYDLFYYRWWTPYTSPFSTDALITEARNLPLGIKRWVRSGGGCEYLIERVYDEKWQQHLAKVHDATSRWGLPCHEASWWRSGSIIADGGPDDCSDGQWLAWRERSGGGWTVRWKCLLSEESIARARPTL